MRLVSRIASVQLAVAMLALVVMGSVTVADVVLKYVFSRPIAGAYVVVESLLPLVVFNGLPAALLGVAGATACVATAARVARRSEP